MDMVDMGIAMDLDLIAQQHSYASACLSAFPLAPPLSSPPLLQFLLAALLRVLVGPQHVSLLHLVGAPRTKRPLTRK